LIVANAPHNALFLESNPVYKVVSAVHNLFEHHRVDAQFNEAKFKWKCACYDAQTETTFVSRLFSVPDKLNYFILDFQRRSGDPFHFQSIYKAINFTLLKSGFVVPCGDSKSLIEPEMRTFRPMALPDDFFAADDDAAEENDSKEYDPLCKMCLSPFIDVQREGLVALANHLESSEFARKSLASFAEKLLEAVALSRDIQVRRLATSAIAWLSIEPSAHRFIKNNGGLRVFVGLFLNGNELVETRRQAGKILQNVREWDAETKSSIKCATISKDARLALLMKDLQSTIL